MNMQQQLTNLRELFMLFEDPKDKFVQLMDMAKESEQLKENEKVEQNKINGKAVTPFLIKEINNYSNNKTLKANVSLIINNAGLAGKIAKNFYS
mgnify:CR=1 FL=1